MIIQSGKQKKRTDEKLRYTHVTDDILGAPEANRAAVNMAALHTLVNSAKEMMTWKLLNINRGFSAIPAVA